jgi:hypothetical protein
VDKHEEIAHLLKVISILKQREMTLENLQSIETMQACLEIVMLDVFGERRKQQ